MSQPVLLRAELADNPANTEGKSFRKKSVIQACARSGLKTFTRSIVFENQLQRASERDVVPGRHEETIEAILNHLRNSSCSCCNDGNARVQSFQNNDAQCFGGQRRMNKNIHRRIARSGIRNVPGPRDLTLQAQPHSFGSEALGINEVRKAPRTLRSDNQQVNLVANRWRQPSYCTQQQQLPL